MLDCFFALLNNNQGVIEFFGFLMVVPFAFLADFFIGSYRRQKHRNALKKVLMHELWVNMNFVAQIEESYNNNLTEEREGVHLPHYPPRVDILEKYIEYNFLNSVEKDNQDSQIREIYAQLKELKREFERWRDFITTHPVKDDVAMYTAFSETALSYIKSTMLNMITVWTNLVIELGEESGTKSIRLLKEKLTSNIRKGRAIKFHYKLNQTQEIDSEKINICWKSNLSSTENKNVIELKKEVPLHDSWNKSDVKA